MKALDILLLILLLWGAYSGFKKGFVAEIFSLGAFFLGAIGSVKLMGRLTNLLQRWEGALGSMAPYIVFICTFITIVLVITLVGKLFRHLVHMTILGSIDKLIGAMLGVAKWIFLVSTLIWLAELLQLKEVHSYIADTYFFPFLKSLAPRFLGWISSCFPAFQSWLERSSIKGRSLIEC